MRALIFILFAFGPICASNAAAQIKIGFVNAERVTRESAPAIRASKRLEKEFEKRQAELKKLDSFRQSLKVVIEGQSQFSSDNERRLREKEFADLSRDFQRKERALREDYAQRQNEELAGIQELANRVIQKIAERDKYDLILQEAVYFNPELDITEKVLLMLSESK